MPNPSRNAFTLVELSIVLVILGLLVGGVLSGQSLIRASELNGLINQQQKFVTARTAFKDKYFSVPGDMANAAQFWGYAAACGGTDGGTATCSGDGDSYARSLYSPSNMLTGVLTSNGMATDEAIYFWQHLSNAGLVEGTYDGISQTPSMKSGRGGMWSVNDLVAATSGAKTLFDGIYRNIFVADSTLLALEAWNIDTKLDDGKPGTGKVVAYASGSPFGTWATGLGRCTTGANSAALTADYLNTGTSYNCGLVFKP